MKRNLKVLGLALAAVLAMSAVAASGASAQKLFHAAQESVFVTGATKAGVEPTLEVGGTGSGVSVKCLKGTYEGTVTGENGTNTTKQVTVHPTYDPTCVLSIGGNHPVVDTHGCDFTLTSAYEASTNGKEHATVGVECTSGHAIRITHNLCSITINSFAHATGHQGVTYTNLKEPGKPDTLTVNATVEGIPYTKSGGFCFLVPGNGHDGVYTDDVIVEARTHTNASMDATTHTWTVTEGAEVSIWHE